MRDDDAVLPPLARDFLDDTMICIRHYVSQCCLPRYGGVWSCRRRATFTTMLRPCRGKQTLKCRLWNAENVNITCLIAANAENKAFESIVEGCLMMYS
jgi:hypothetical protein